MPFLLEVDEAAELIGRAIVRRKREYTLPWPIAVGTRLLSWLPNAIFDALGGRMKARLRGDRRPG